MKIRSVCIAATMTLFTLAVSANAGTWNVVTNFNASNNPNASSVFSYGNGGSPAAFVADSISAPNCISGAPTPNFCYLSGSSFPNQTGILWNGTAGNIQTNGSTSQPNTEVYMDPQTVGAMLRFTAPTTNVYSVTGAYLAMDSSHHTTDGSVYANGVLAMGPSALGGFGSTAAINLSGLSLSAGQTIDFLVVTGSDGSFLATGLAATITSPSGVTSTPEPATFGLAGLALIGFGAVRRRRSKAE